MMTIKSIRNFCRAAIIYAILLCLVLLLYLQYNPIDPGDPELNIYFRGLKINDVNREFLVKTTGCQIPPLDPFDKTILKYIYKEKPFPCSDVLPLVESDLNSVYIDERQLPYYNVSKDKLSCCYQPFWRDTYGLSQFGNCKPFESSAKIKEEYVKVICTSNKTEILKDFHAFVPIKKNATKKNNSKLKVLVVGLDSMSRSNFYRQMPLTKDYLLKLNAIEMIGYNTIGDNTFLMPILTGLTVEELQQKYNLTDKSGFDNCDFIWKNYSEAGYLTAFADDTGFNYQKRRFNKQPTDYYWRTFYSSAEQEIGQQKLYSSDLCIGRRPSYTVLLDYAQKFALSLRNENYFGLFWSTSLTHDDINYAQLGDKYYKLFFQGLRENNILNDTILIALSDHGFRWGGIRSTHQGRIEERLPFLFFMFPPWFIEKHPSAISNLRKNAKRLTTPFDLHETLLDLINTEQITANNIKKRSKELHSKRGTSLFLLVPENRTCSSAKISSHWCTCQKIVEIDRNSSIAQKAAEYIVNYMNGLLKGYKRCALLEVDTIVNARLSTSNDYFENNMPIQDFTIMLKTKPGGALFGGTVRCVYCETNDPFSLTGTISRLNSYGNKTACIENNHLKLYCYCGS